VADHRFTVAPGTVLVIDTFAGAVTITPTPDTDQMQIRVLAEATGGKPGAAERWTRDVVVTAEQDRKAVRITVRHRDGPVALDLGSRPLGSIRLAVSVPLHTPLDLTTRSGSIEVGNDLVGDIRARAVIGTLFFGRTQGAIDARVDDGDITVSRASGVVDLRTLRGDIRVGTLFDRSTLETNSGNISIFSAQRQVNARAEAGDITATLAAELSGDSALTTAGGDIRVSVDPTSNFYVRARSVWGRVSSEVPMRTTSGGDGRRKFEGTLNQGGAQISLLASGGNILMTPFEPAND